MHFITPRQEITSVNTTCVRINRDFDSTPRFAPQKAQLTLQQSWAYEITAFVSAFGWSDSDCTVSREELALQLPFLWGGGGVAVRCVCRCCWAFLIKTL